MTVYGFADQVVYPEVSETYFTPTISPVPVGPSKLRGQHSRSDSVSPELEIRGVFDDN